MVRVTEPALGTVYINWLDWEPVVWWSSWQVDGEGRPRAEAHHSSADEAVAWGRERCARVVVFGRDGEAYWAGSDPAPADAPGAWDTAPPKAH
jgi:hypothetical protein